MDHKFSTLVKLIFLGQTQYIVYMIYVHYLHYNDCIEDVQHSFKTHSLWGGGATPARMFPVGIG